MNIKSILLGTGASLMIASGAQAADLPGEVVPVAVDYVKVCDAMGKGFFYIPGTDTCLQIGGRVRFRAGVENSDYSDAYLAALAAGAVAAPDETDYLLRADARIGFDARTATEYGTLRSYFRLDSLTDGTTGVEVGQAFINLGYMTAGYFGDLSNGDVFLGESGYGWYFGDNDRVGFQLLASDLGGGFYIGAGVFSQADGLVNNLTNTDDELEFQAKVGIASQPWGGVDLSFSYRDTDTVPAGAVGFDDQWGVKATADLILMEGLTTRFTAGYAANVEVARTYAAGGAINGRAYDDVITLSAAAKYAFNDRFDAYAGVRYDMVDDVAGFDSDDFWVVQLGADYVITPGLTLTAEVNWEEDNAFNEDTEINGFLMLTRNW